MSLLNRLFCLLLVIVSSSTLGACGFLNLKRAVPSEDVRKVLAAKQVVLPNKVQEFGDKAHKFKMLPPKGFLYSQVETSHGSIFTFSTPRRKDGRAGVLTVSCVDNKKGAKKALPSFVLTAVLEQLTHSCIDFHEGSVESFDDKGRSFLGAQFTGSYGGYYPIIGYVYVTPVEDAFYIIQWQDGELHYPLTKDVMRNSFNSLEIEY